MRKLLLLLFFPISVLAQRTIPYPIIFVHGLKNNSGAWYNNLLYLKSMGLRVDIDQTGKDAGNGSRLDFCLNADNNESTSVLNRNGKNGYYGDVYEFDNAIDPNNDLFVVNFGVENCSSGNQSAIVKQGFALGLAIKKVLEVTQASKVILVGHSMGGLAIREYLINSNNWVNKYGGPQVAHFVTLGTPHGGSDTNLLGIINSEAVRDLRTKYYTGTNGVYLFGGDENASSMKPNIVTNYPNVDVNCNGITGEKILGLNQYALPSDVTFVCIIGNSALWSDIVVTEYSQNLINFQKPTALYNIFQISAAHWEERSALLDIFSAIQFAYIYGQVDIGLNKAFTGAFVNRLDASNNFSNTYKFFVFKGGKLKLNSNNPYGGFHNIQVVNRDKGEILIPYVNGDYREYTLPVGGNYMIIFTSKIFPKGVQVYNFQTEYCQFPDAPVISSNKTSICQGEQVELSATAGFDAYNWYLNGVEIQKGSSPTIKADKGGTYSMLAFGCGTNVVSNQVNVTVKTLPDKPTISVSSEGLQSSSATGNQWYLDGQPIAGATQQILANFGSGNYSVKVTTSGCSNESAPFMITGTEEEVFPTMLLYPNPNDGRINLNLANGKQQLTIVDYTGRTLLSQEVIIDKSPFLLDVSYLSAGEYLLQVKSAERRRTFKFVVF